jgi:GT2 family glycosyltransferase
MQPNKYSITFACYNAVAYTKWCVQSMIKHGTPLDRLVVVDNGSTDETRAYLETLDLGGRIYNPRNLGCGVAWNQGALALQSEWSIIMNNDVLVSAHWIENLLQVAEQKGLKVISPALIEGLLDYDFDEFSIDASRKMSTVLRSGARHAVCLAVHQSVWMEVGYFQPIPKLLGYEDTMFFHELAKAKIPTGMTGASWLHHFGSITQTAMKQEQGLRQKDGLSNRYNYRLLNQSWLERKLTKVNRKKQEKLWRGDELEQYNMTMHGLRVNGAFEWL